MEALFATFGINAKLLVIQAVNFAIVLTVLTIFLFRPLLKVLDERKAKIAKGVEDADHAAKARETVEGERAGIIRDAEKNAEAVIARAQEEGKTERANIVHEAQARAEATLKDAELQAVEARRQALAQSEKEIAATAVLAAEKILAQK